MPQPPSPLMGIIWPSDHGDDDAWDVLMDTAVRVTIDGHNHAAGSGAKVNISSLAYDADISFIDAGGGKHAITNMKAISFFPSPPSAMTGFSGAFFVSDGTGGTVLNELYFRTPLGTNVQFTDAGTLNVGAFAGTIGGDYVGAGALESFVDSADAYLFQQQVGAGVRQFAKMQCADLELFEFKAVGASPVPVQAVTLKSPAALAAGYALTFPGALPSAGAGNAPLAVDSTGAITAGGTQTLSIAAADIVGLLGAAITFPAGNLIAQMTGAVAAMGVSVKLPVGSRVTAIRYYIADNAIGSTKVAAAFSSTVLTTGVTTDIVVGGNSAGSGAQQTLTNGGLTTVITAGTVYTAWIKTTTGSAAVTMNGIEIDYDRP